MSNVVISAAVKAKSAAIAEKQEISVEWVLEKLKKTADTCKVPAVEVRATELIGKHLGMFREKIDLDLGPATSTLIERLTKALERTG